MEDCVRDLTQQAPWWWNEIKPVLFAVAGMAALMFGFVFVAIIRTMMMRQERIERIRRRRPPTNWRDLPD